MEGLICWGTGGGIDEAIDGWMDGWVGGIDDWGRGHLKHVVVTVLM